jgi:hypothetical protein
MRHLLLSSAGDTGDEKKLKLLDGVTRDVSWKGKYSVVNKEVVNPNKSS